VQAAGLRVADELVQEVEAFSRAEGARAMDRLLDLPEPPDAVYCFNDLLALGALHALQRRGVEVPRDVAVIGTDGIAESGFATPTLSTVVQDTVQIATLAVDALLLRLAEPDEPPREVMADHRLVARQSTVAAGG
jgi:DNA-binding LacI/PurR family transcriptional regulator